MDTCKQCATSSATVSPSKVAYISQYLDMLYNLQVCHSLRQGSSAHGGGGRSTSRRVQDTNAVLALLQQAAGRYLAAHSE